MQTSRIADPGPYITWNEAFGAESGLSRLFLVVAAVNLAAVLIVRIVVEQDLLPIHWELPLSYSKVLQCTRARFSRTCHGSATSARYLRQPRACVRWSFWCSGSLLRAATWQCTSEPN